VTPESGLWLDDDTIVFAPTAFSPLMRVKVAGGATVPLTSLAEDETGHRFPQRLPGRQLLYFSVNRTPEKSGTRLSTIDSPDQPISFFPGFAVAESVKGALLFARGRAGAFTLLAQPMALPDGQLTGEPVEIGRTRISETLGRAVMSTSPDGVIVTLGPIESVGQFTWLSRDGRVLQTVGAQAVQMGVELSPDRQQAATFRSGEIWALNLSRPVPIRLTTGVNRHPIWSPDGGQILTLDQGRGILAFDLVTTTTASAEEKTLHQGPDLAKPMGWTRDHRLVWIQGTPSGASIWTMDSNGKASEVFHESAFIAEARVSPDGRWIVYSSNRSGRFEIELSRFPEFGQRYPLSVAGGGYLDGEPTAKKSTSCRRTAG
jgi:eukaryotic-like serine/threonine-protein kinase